VFALVVEHCPQCLLIECRDGGRRDVDPGTEQPGAESLDSDAAIASEALAMLLLAPLTLLAWRGQRPATKLALT
jgi:hypothetical protein